MKILFLEPFFGGSHRDFALGFADHSSHCVDLVTLPDRFWKWRMRGAALHFIRSAGELEKYDLIFATDMMDIADFKALAGKKCPPVVLYFHENQISYPLGPHGKKDSHLGFTNIISGCAADLLLFNSHFHLKDFMGSARKLARQMPDTRPEWMLDELELKARVLYPGCRFGKDHLPMEKSSLDRPLIIWNHRWDYDKNPEDFFWVLSRIQEKGIPFYLALLGEQYQIVPEVFKKALTRFSDELLVSGFQKSRRDYLAWLAKGQVVISTAIQENFGISIIEAVRYGCFPLLPSRLSYPELMPDDLHHKILFNSRQELLGKLESVLTQQETILPLCRKLSGHVSRFSWEILAKEYDELLEQVSK